LFVGFNFSVGIIGSDEMPEEFIEVSGLDKQVRYEEFSAGGMANQRILLPKSIEYKELVLKKGKTNKESSFDKWINQFLSNDQNQENKHRDLLVSLNDENKTPLVSWLVSNARIAHYSNSDFNAVKNELVIEKISLIYDYFKTLN